MKFKVKSCLASVLMLLLMSLSFSNNYLRVARDDFYQYFQRESESLVLGAIVAQKYDLEFPYHANIGYAAIDRFENNPIYIVQNYSLIHDQLPDYHAKIEDITYGDWVHGVSKTKPVIILKKDPKLFSYIGSYISLSQLKRREIKFIEEFSDYTNVTFDGPAIDFDKLPLQSPVKISFNSVAGERIVMAPYLSQYGIQGIAFAKIFKLVSSLEFLQNLNVTLLVVVLFSLAVLFGKIISREFSVLFLISMIFSPWIVAFAKNLYWVPFVWFLPAIFSGIIFLSSSWLVRTLCLILLYLIFLVKSLSGYEYISTIILFTVSFFTYDFFNTYGRYTKKESFGWATVIFCVAVLGFFTALIIHADTRAETIFKGLQSIAQDVQRRTWGDPEKYGESLRASVWSLISAYTFDWKTDFLKLIPGISFAFLFFLSVMVVIYNFFKNEKDKWSYIGLIIAFIGGPLSWIVLAKGHSGHLHMNFVLWYFGFATVIIYIPYKFVKSFILSWRK